MGIEYLEFCPKYGVRCVTVFPKFDDSEVPKAGPDRKIDETVP